MKLHCSEISGSVVSKLPERANKLIPTPLNASFRSSFASMQLSLRPSNSPPLIREIRLLPDHYFRTASWRFNPISREPDFSRVSLLSLSLSLSLSFVDSFRLARSSRTIKKIRHWESFVFEKRRERTFLTAKGNFDRERFVHSSRKNQRRSIRRLHFIFSTIFLVRNTDVWCTTIETSFAL